MVRNIDDAGYIEYLGTPIRRRQYESWKSRMLSMIDNVAASFAEVGLAETMAKYGLSDRDVVLLKRLSYFHDHEIPEELIILDKETHL